MRCRPRQLNDAVRRCGRRDQGQCCAGRTRRVPLAEKSTPITAAVIGFTLVTAANGAPNPAR